MKNNAEKEQMSAVMMNQFGINTVVLTAQKEIESISRVLTSTPDYFWSEKGKGKACLHKQLHSKLKTEDSYFETNLNEAVPGNPRWDKFMENCVFFAVLNTVVRDEPLHLVHPTLWDKKVKRSKNTYVAKRRPCVLPDVPVYSSSEQ